MKNLKNKRGISLIVLVITIIVMIILATAIILSLNNSGIIGKANKAKNDSDMATLKEYVNTLKLDWEFMTAEEKTEAGSFSEYATSKLEEKGYNRMVTEDGIILTEGATAAVKAGIEIGDEVTGYNSLLGSAKTVEYDFNGGTDFSVESIVDMTWKYAGITEDGKIRILAEVPSNIEDKNKVETSQTSAIFYTVESTLDNICNEMYTTDKGIAKSIDVEDVVALLGYKGPMIEYSGQTLLDVTLANNLTWIEDANGAFLGSSVFPAEGYSTVNNKNILINGYPDVENDSEYITKEAGKSLVFNSPEYWLASSWCSFGGGTSNWEAKDIGVECADFYFGIYSCSSQKMSGTWSWHAAYFPSYSASCAIRPVVTLNADVELVAPETSGGAWTIK